jgi:hypothetical protein
MIVGDDELTPRRPRSPTAGDENGRSLSSVMASGGCEGANRIGVSNQSYTISALSATLANPKP